MSKKPIIFDKKPKKGKEKPLSGDLFFKYKSVDGYQNKKEDFELTHRYINDKTTEKQFNAYIKLELEYKNELKREKKALQERWNNYLMGIERGIHDPDGKKHVKKEIKDQLKQLKKNKMKEARALYKGFLGEKTKKEFNDKAGPDMTR